MKKEKSGAFLSGVLFLMISNLLVKVIGLVFKIPIQHLIGDEGMGYFNIAYSVYSWLYLLSSAGLPVAVSVIISRENALGHGSTTRAVFRVALYLFGAIGSVCTLFMLLGSRFIASAIEVEDAYLCIAAIAPTLFFVCISSAIRGYYQGFQIMTVTGVSQITEAAGKVTLGLALAVYSIKKGNPVYVTAAYAISGIMIGTFVSMLYCIITKAVSSPRLNTSQEKDGYIRESNTSILKSLSSIAIPITISASVMGLTSVIDATLSSGRLQAIGYTQPEATAIYGNYSTLAVSMFNMPTVLIYPIAYAVVPYLTRVITAGDRESVRRIVTSCVKIVCLIALPCAVGLGVLAKPILALLFSDSSAALAAPMLSVLSVSVFFCALLAISNSVLQASGNERLPIISMLAGAAVKLISTYALVGWDKVGRIGIPISTNLCYLTIIVLNMYFMTKKTQAYPNIISSFLKPSVAAVLCGASAYFIQHILAPRTDSDAIVFASIAGGGVVYIIAVLLLRCVGEEDIRLLPGADKIIGILKKIKII